LNTLSLLTIVILTILYYFSYVKNKLKPLQVILFGFTLYMIIEIFSPVYRHQYNTVQWFPLVLTALLIPMNRRSPGLLLLALGLVLNMVNFPWLPMRHTLGEFAWLAAMLLISFTDASVPLINKKTLPT
jgi:hypothetical protein